MHVARVVAEEVLEMSVWRTFLNCTLETH